MRKHSHMQILMTFTFTSFFVEGWGQSKTHWENIIALVATIKPSINTACLMITKLTKLHKQYIHVL